ncbi:MAG: hypothetical protein QNK24_13735 [Desulfuromusa sp.]|nr:hypothetical protein [Desulfuromusa sp.]
MITKKLMLKRLEKKGNLTIPPNTPLMEFTLGGIKYQRAKKIIAWASFDTVIIASGMDPEDDLYQQLPAAGKSVQIVGDADDSADIYAATQTGDLAAINLNYLFLQQSP